MFFLEQSHHEEGKGTIVGENGNNWETEEQVHGQRNADLGNTLSSSYVRMYTFFYLAILTTSHENTIVTKS